MQPTAVTSPRVMQSEKGENMNYSITLVVEVKSIEDLIEEIFTPYYEDCKDEQLELDYPFQYTIIHKNGMFAHWYSREDKQRRVDNKRHKKPRYSYHKARA